MVNVVVNNGQYKITIPKDIALEKGWDSKTKLRFVEDAEGNIILREIVDAQSKAKGGRK